MKLITILLFAALPLFSFASDHVIFSCTNKQGRKVVVQSIGNQIQYSFGKPGKPELVFRNPRNQVIELTKEKREPNPRMQLAILKNGQYEYWVSTYANPTSNETREGVGIWKGNHPISEVTCDKRKNDLYTNFDDDFFE